MAAMRMVPLLEYYVTDSMYHQLQCISDVSMERFCPWGIIGSFQFDQIQKLSRVLPTLHYNLFERPQRDPQLNVLIVIHYY